MKTTSTKRGITPLKKWVDVVNELRKQTDRGLAVVGATIVQEQLKALILRSFIRVNRKVEGMLGPDGPLGTFAAQIRLAYATGLVSHAVYCDLELIREIRNRFAHFIHYARKETEPVELVTFAHKAIRDWASSLRAPTELGIVEATTPRARFAHTCNRLQVMFSIAMNPSEGGRIPVGYPTPENDV